LRGAAQSVLLYDEDCGFCRWSLDKILAWDRAERVRPVPIQSEEASRLLGDLDLGALADKLPEEISGGQAQRAAVARALITRPALLLADEPTGQLDHPTASHLLDLLDKRLEGLDTAVVIATHDAFVAGRMKTQWRIEHGVLTSAR